MKNKLVVDELWEVICPIIPKYPMRSKGEATAQIAEPFLLELFLDRYSFELSFHLAYQ